MNPLTQYKVLKIIGNNSFYIEDTLALEKEIEIFLNNKKIASLLATPLHLKELIIGYLYNQNIIKDVKDLDINHIKIIENEKSIKVYVNNLKISNSLVSASPNYLEYKNDFKIEIKKIFKIFKKFRSQCQLFKKTGCFHSAGITSGEDIIFLTEDIGRFNVIDKIIGHAILNKLLPNESIVLFTGRISSQIILKFEKWKPSIIVSRSAPTSLSIQIAEEIGITLIGFLRGNRCNIYTHPYKIIF